MVLNFCGLKGVRILKNTAGKSPNKSRSLARNAPERGHGSDNGIWGPSVTGSSTDSQNLGRFSGSRSRNYAVLVIHGSVELDHCDARRALPDHLVLSADTAAKLSQFLLLVKSARGQSGSCPDQGPTKRTQPALQHTLYAPYQYAEQLDQHWIWPYGADRRKFH
ncbi:hypothetical protein D3C77_394630 [compost metagenome]